MIKKLRYSCAAVAAGIAAAAVLQTTAGAAHADAVPPGPPQVTDLTLVGDLDGDGHADLLAKHTVVDAGELWLYPGNGTFFGTPRKIGQSWDSMSELTAVGDLTGDGTGDVAAVENTTGKLWLYPGNREGIGTRTQIGSGWNGMGELEGVGDMTGDGHPDLIAVERSNGKLWLYPGVTGGLGARVQIGSGGWNGMAELAAAGDLTGDGQSDLAAVERTTGKLWLYPGAEGQLGARKEIGTNWTAMRDIVGNADINGDALPDVLAIERSTGKLWAYPGVAGGRLGARVLVGGGWND
jgi:hypothetical protein